MKYVNEKTLEIISEVGKLEMMSIDNVQGTMDELNKLGYESFVDESTDCLICNKRESKENISEFIKSLARIEVDADRGLEDVRLDSYKEWIKDRTSEYGLELNNNELVDIWKEVEEEIVKIVSESL